MPKKSVKNKLVIVESPAKAKTIEKILGSSYKVISSYGHIIDLPKTKIGVDVNNDFKPSYHTIKGKGPIIKQLKEASKKADEIYLASDPDREGESIAWHIANTLKLDHNKKNRIEFHEITEKAIKDAVKNPRKINISRVNSQQARRILDRLVGYEISPFLWKLISPNTSAGRVQSVALKIICELEDKIKNFVPEKYWDVKGIFDEKYNLNLYKIDNKKIDKLKDEKLLDRAKKDLKKKYEVISSKVSKKTKNPPLPLKTSTLQQLASSYLGFSASKTMMVAQKLYEGISIKGEHKGLITYMRTDSTRISEEAKEMARNYITKNFGKEYLGSASPKTKKESKNVQDAHEGIRPTDINYTPESIMEFLDKDQFKLYNLIWQRFLVSQLAAMKYEQFEYILEKGKIEYRGTINKIIFDGYYKVFKEDEDLPIGDFPKIKEGDKFTLDKLDIKEDYTKPPARLTESSLVKTLEAEGIGRPSTYASIIDTLKKREYVELQNKSFIPTEIGYEVKTQLDKFFPNIMNIKFTAKLEDELDEVDSGDKNWIDLLKVFYTELQKYEEKCKAIVEEELEKLVESDVIAKNGKPMVMKIGRFGRYLASQDTESKENISLKGIDISLEDIKKGKVVIVVDDENRENEGDFIAAAEKVTPEMINFMITNGRGLVCAPLTEKRCAELDLPMMVQNNTVLHETQFTVSVDLKGQGCTTGISAFDRAKTIQALVDPKTTPFDLGRPGHIFPLRAKEGGVLRRTGHTEAAIDLTRIAGLKPAGILVEILNEDGTMARLPQLVEVAKNFDLKIISIEDLIAYRMRKDTLVIKKEDFLLQTPYGEFRLRAYEQTTNKQIHLAFTQGTWKADEPVLTRVHSSFISNDILEVIAGDKDNPLERIFRKINEEGKGAVIVINKEGYSKTLLQHITEIKEHQTGHPLPQVGKDTKDIGMGAQILNDLGIRKLRLLTNSKNASNYVGMSGYGLEITEEIPY